MNHKLVLALGALGLLLGLAACADKSQGGIDQDGQLSADQDGIVHGETVSPKDFESKSVVAIVAELEQGEALCTGTLLSTETVLTAAHCVEEIPQKLVVVFNNRVRGAKADDLRVADNFVQNPRWHRPTKEGKGDLAIIHFTGGLPAGYQPVTLVDRKFQPTTGDQVVLSGYGVTDGEKNAGSGVLRQTTTQVMQLASPTEVVTDGRQSSVCFGDSGGPAFIKKGNDYVQWGVASSVMNQACNEASVHTNIASYISWINSTEKKMHQK